MYCIVDRSTISTGHSLDGVLLKKPVRVFLHKGSVWLVGVVFFSLNKNLNLLEKMFGGYTRGGKGTCGSSAVFVMHTTNSIRQTV